VGALVAAGGCVPTRVLELPALDGETRSMLVVLERPGAPVRLFARPLGDDPINHVLDGGARVTVLELGRALEYYDLTPGPVAVASSEPSRPLPPWLAAHVLEASGWAELTDLDALASLRLPPVDARRCAELGGCAAGDVCDLPCPRPAAPVSPAPAELPRAELCPEGWDSVELPDLAGGRYCEPYPGLIPSECPAGEFLFPGEHACAPLGACAEGNYPAELLARADVVFVDAAAAPGGAGTLARPYSTLASALAVAPPGGVVAIARGEYRAPPTLDAPVALVGACSASTIVSAIAAEPVIRASGAQAITLRGLTLRGSDQPIRIVAGAHVRLEDVVVEGATASRVADATLEVARVVLAGAGLEVIGGRLDGERLRIDEVATGLVLDRGATAELRGVAVADAGEGLRVEGAGGVHLRELVVERSGTVGLHLRAAATATISDFVVRGTTLGGAAVIGIDVAGSALVLERGLVEDVRGRAVFVHDGAVVVVEDVTTRCSGIPSPDPNAPHFTGVEVDFGGRLRATRLASAGDDGHGLAVRGQADVDVDDLTITRRCRSVGSPVSALLIDSASDATLRRVWIEPSDGDGIHMGDDGTRATIEDLELGPSLGDGLQVGCGGSLITACRVAITLERVRIVEPLLAGALVFTAGPVVMRDVQVLGPGGPERAGLGLEVRRLATLSVSRFALTGLAGGVRLHDGGALSLSDGVLRDNDVALETDPTANLDALFETVLFEDNRSLQSSF
jgi:hypothetical protein